MGRDLTVAFSSALADQTLRPVIFFEGQFASGGVRLWSGRGEITWNGKAWSGAGTLLGLGSIEETGEVVAGGTAISLSGVPLDLVQMAIAEARQGLPGRVWLGLRGENGSVIADPVQTIVTNFQWQHLPLHAVFLSASATVGAAGMAAFDKLRSRGPSPL